MATAGPTRLARAILDAAVKAVEKGGEAALRVHDVASRAGCSVALLYRHFGSREGLLEAVMFERLERFGVVDSQALMDMVDASPDVQTFVRLHEAFARDVFGPERERNRQFLAEFIATSRTRPELRRAFVEQQRQTQAAFTAVVRAAQEKGLFRSDIDARAVASFARAYTFGRVLAEIDPDTTGGFEDWVRCAGIFLANLGPPASTAERSRSTSAGAKKVALRRPSSGTPKVRPRSSARPAPRRAAT